MSNRVFSPVADYFKSGYVLVADGNVGMRKSFRAVLKAIGVSNVREAADGNSALRILRESNEPCLFVFTEWAMPQITGIELVREIRATGRIQDTPIFIITAEFERENIVLAGEAGINQFMIKPFVAKSLEEKILHTLKMRANPPEHVKLIKAAEELFKRGEHGKALAVFEDARRMRESARVLVNIGETYEVLGDADSAHSSYGRAIEVQPLYLKAYTSAASLYIKLGDEGAALEFLAKAAEISPNNTERNFQLGQLYLKKGDHAKAEEVFKKISRENPEKSLEIGEELLKAGVTGKAEQYFRLSLEKDASSVHIYNRIGISLRRQGKWQEAISEYEKALKLDPNNEGLYFNLAKACLEGKNTEAARKYFMKVLQLSPNNPEAKNELAQLGRGGDW